MRPLWQAALLVVGVLGTSLATPVVFEDSPQRGSSLGSPAQGQQGYQGPQGYQVQQGYQPNLGYQGQQPYQPYQGYGQRGRDSYGLANPSADSPGAPPPVGGEGRLLLQKKKRKKKKVICGLAGLLAGLLPGLLPELRTILLILPRRGRRSTRYTGSLPVTLASCEASSAARSSRVFMPAMGLNTPTRTSGTTLTLSVSPATLGPATPPAPVSGTHADSSSESEEGPKSGSGLGDGIGEVVVASPNMSNDYFFLVSMVVGVIVLALLVIVVIKCRAGAVQGLHDGQNGKTDMADRAPLPLPRPPDDLMPSSPRPKHFGMPALSLASTPTLSTLPQCKVIPLGTPMGTPLGPVDSVTSSEPELNVNLRYPYGADDTPQEWSSFDATAAPSASDLSFSTQAHGQHNNQPMLRRNQYWV